MLQISNKIDNKNFKKAQLLYKSSSQRMTEILTENYITFDLYTIIIALILNSCVSLINR